MYSAIVHEGKTNRKCKFIIFLYVLLSFYTRLREQFNHQTRNILMKFDKHSDPFHPCSCNLSLNRSFLMILILSTKGYFLRYILRWIQSENHYQINILNFKLENHSNYLILYIVAVHANNNSVAVVNILSVIMIIDGLTWWSSRSMVMAQSFYLLSILFSFNTFLFLNKLLSIIYKAVFRVD